MTESEWKGHIIDDAIRIWEQTTQYRWSDVWDYVCDNMNLDNKWDMLVDITAFAAVRKEFHECYAQYINEQKYKLKSSELDKQISILLAEKLEQDFERSLNKKL